VRVKIVVHPSRVNGLAAELDRIDDIEWVDARSDQDVVDALDDGASVLLTYRWRPEFLHPGLRWIQSISAGFDQYPFEDFERRGIVLTTATGVHISVAESAIGLVLALTRRLGRAIRHQIRHEWDQMEGMEVAGSTVGIVGLGTIGEEIALRLQGWDVDLIGLKRRPDEYDGVVPTVYGPEALIEVCHRSDILILVLPASAETRHMIGATELGAVGDGLLVNVGRGSVVDEEALVLALRDGRLRGAGLDVFEKEPLPEGSPLWDMENVVITAHSAGISPRYGERLARIFRRNLAAFQGEDVPWINRVVDGVRKGQVGSLRT
jgi:D-2-hydroxyacid dehydrogenase (NADP+)